MVDWDFLRNRFFCIGLLIGEEMFIVSGKLWVLDRQELGGYAFVLWVIDGVERVERSRLKWYSISASQSH